MLKQLHSGTKIIIRNIIIMHDINMNTAEIPRLSLTDTTFDAPMFN